MKLNGIEFFPYPTSNSTALQLLLAKYDDKGIVVYLSLLQKIFREEGYYYSINDNIIILLSHEFRTTKEVVVGIIDECLENNLFDKSMYEKYKILTSNEIQADYLHAVQRRKNIDIKEEYRLKSVQDYFSKDNTNQEMYAENKKMYTKTQKMHTESEKKDTKTNIVYNSIEENSIEEERIREESIEENIIEEEGEEKENKEKEIDTLLSSPNDFSSSPSIIKNVNSLNRENNCFAENNTNSESYCIADSNSFSPPLNEKDNFNSLSSKSKVKGNNSNSENDCFAENINYHFENNCFADNNANSENDSPCHSDRVKRVEESQRMKIKFKEHTNKFVDDVDIIEKDIDIDLLIKKVNNSQFLKNAPNFTLKQCLKHYDKIIAGVYDNDKKEEISAIFENNDTKKYGSRGYTKEELNSFYTDIDEILKIY